MKKWQRSSQDYVQSSDQFKPAHIKRTICTADANEIYIYGSTEKISRMKETKILLTQNH